MSLESKVLKAALAGFGIGIIALLLLWGKQADAQDSAAGATADSQSTSQAGAQAGAAAVINIGGGGGGGVDAQGNPTGQSVPGIAGGTGVGIGVGGSSSASANNAGNHQIIQYNTEATDLGDAVGTAIAPSLTTTLSDTCMGSTSGGLGVSGGGISFGSTWSDEECVRRLHARQVGSWGQGTLAMEIMCASPHVMEADARLVAMGETPHCSANAVSADGETAHYIKIYPLDPELTAYYGGDEDTLTVDEYVAAGAKR